MNIEEYPYPIPDWLQGHLQAITGLEGFEGNATEVAAFGEHFARGTDLVAAAYFSLFMADPDEAIEQMGTYFSKFKDINNDPHYSIGLLTRMTPEQFGLIANIASLHYDSADEAERIRILNGLDGFLRTKSSMNLPGFVSTLRNPQLMGDLIFHWSSTYWDSQINSPLDHFLRTADVAAVEQQLQHPANNPLLFALAAPLKTTAPAAREYFRNAYPLLAEQGLDVIAAALLCQGAQEDVLHDHDPSFHKLTWESSIDAELKAYSEGYRLPLLERMISGDFKILDEEMSFPQLVQKLTNTAFSLDEAGRLVRQAKK